MFRWLRALRIFTSRMAVIGKPFSSCSVLIRFSATTSPVSLSAPMNTLLRHANEKVSRRALDKPRTSRQASKQAIIKGSHTHRGEASLFILKNSTAYFLFSVMSLRDLPVRALSDLMLLLEDGNIPKLGGCHDGNRRPAAALLIMIRLSGRRRGGRRWRSRWRRWSLLRSCSCCRGSRWWTGRGRPRRRRRTTTLLLLLLLLRRRRWPRGRWGLDHTCSCGRHSVRVEFVAVLPNTAAAAAASASSDVRGLGRQGCNRCKLLCTTLITEPKHFRS